MISFYRNYSFHTPIVMGLRYLDRDGNRILQQLVCTVEVDQEDGPARLRELTEAEWRDVPNDNGEWWA